MTNYPQSVHFSGLNKPRRIEGTAHALEVHGTIPPEIEGVFYRCIPDAAHPPRDPGDVILSADGAICRVTFEKGHVSYALRYVQTERFMAEAHAGKSLFGRYRNPFTDDPSVRHVDRTVANTSPVWHAGRLIMTKEDGRPYEIEPETLETLGKFDYGGKLRSLTHTAHCRIDPRTDEMFFFGYECDGIASDKIAYGHVAADGTLLSEQEFKAPYAAFSHDFAVTDQHAVFPIFPTTADYERIASGGPHWVHEQDRESWVGIMPRDGDTEQMIWFKGPQGVHSYHIMNAFTKGSQVHLDMCLANTNSIPFVNEDSDLDVPLSGALVRWTMDLDNPEKGIFESKLNDTFCEMPLTRDEDQGIEYDHGWYLTFDPADAPPIEIGPAGIGFNRLVRIDLESGRQDVLPFGPKWAVNEPVHVPSEHDGHGGWLVCEVDHEFHPDRFDQEIWIIPADTPQSGPVARIVLPFTTRAQLHGCWVDRDTYETRRSLAPNSRS